MIKWLKANRLDVIVWTICTLFLFVALRGLFVNEIIAGWDTTAHMYLLTKMVEFMKEWQISGYDPNWYGGYPAFTFYGPLPYILMAVPHLASFGKLSLPWCFNLFLFLQPFLFLAGVCYASRVWFGKSAGAISMVFGMIFLTAIKYHAYLGIGIHSVVYLGLFTNIFAITLMLFLLGVVEMQRKTHEKKYLIVAAILLAMIILTHAMTTLFAGMLLTIFTVINFKNWWKQYLIVGFGSLVLSSFWLVPFLMTLEFSSGEKMNTQGSMVNDPLFALFPLLDKVPSHVGIYILPGLLILVCLVTGLVRLSRGKMAFWPFSFLLALVVLPREYLVNFLDLPLHYYRFNAHIVVLGIFLSTTGLLFIFEKISKLKPKLRVILRAVLIYVVVVSVLSNFLDHLGLSKNPENYQHKYSLSEYPKNADAEAMMEYVSTLKPGGRVAVNTSIRFQDDLGTPHFFSTMLPLKYNIPVFPGLLAESALSTRFVLPVMSRVGSSFNWGETSLLYDQQFSDQSLFSMFRRLKLFGVEYILTTNENAETFTKNVDRIFLTLDKKIGDFSLLKVNDFSPMIEQVNFKPFLFVDNGGVNFMTFSKEWFKDAELFGQLVIYTENDLAEIPESERAQLAGYIVSMPKGSAVDEEQKQYWKNQLGDDKKVIFLNSELASEELTFEGAEFIKSFGINISIEKVKNAIFKFQAENSEGAKSITSKIMNGKKIEFESVGGTLINYSYFPRWESADEGQIVYWATPSMMFVFAKGETELRYD